MAEIEQYLVPKTGVEQVQHGVLGAADVQINARGRVGCPSRPRRAGDSAPYRPHPVLLRVLADKGRVVLRVEVAQVIPATAGPLGHGVGFASRAVRQIHPVLRAREGGLAVGRGFVIVERRRQHGQGRFRQRRVKPAAARVLLPNDRERLAPIPLPAEEPVAEFVVDRALAQAFGFEPIGDFPFGFRRGQSIERNLRVRRIDVHTLVDERRFEWSAGLLTHSTFRCRTCCGSGEPRSAAVAGRYDLDNFQAEPGSEFEVARVVSRNRHDCARAVARQDVVRNPDGNFLAVDRVDCVGAGKNAGLFLRQFSAFEVRLPGDFGFVGFDCSALF